MESAAEALRLAFAVLVFVMALSIAMFMFSQARETADIVLGASDNQRYYEPIQTGTENRIVGFETVIPTVYKYDKERYKVTFKTGTYDATTDTVTITGPLEIYTTESNQKLWNEDYVNDYDGTTNSASGTEKRICSLDLVEETQRNEPWVGNTDEIKKHLDAIFSGGEYVLPQYSADSGNTLDYSGNPLEVERNSDSKFVEQIGKIATTEERVDDITGVTGNKTTTKVIITYILIN